MTRRLLPEGWAVAAVGAALAMVGVLGSDERLVALGAVSLSFVAVSWLDGRRRLRRVAVERRLPAELWAGQRARGRYAVVAPAPLRLGLREVDGSGAAGGDVGASTSLPGMWRVARRGWHAFDALRMTTRSPLGLVEHERSAPVADEADVWPSPGVGRARGSVEPGSEDLVGLRVWRVGERTTRIAWRASIRRGQLLAADRVDSHGPAIVELAPARGAALEAAVSDATAAVLDGFRQGRRVGLRLGRRVLPARSGGAWRRTLLSALARWDGAP